MVQSPYKTIGDVFVASVKLNITLAPDLLARMDAYSSENSMSRSGLISLAVSQYLNSIEVMPSVNKLLASFAAVTEGTLKGEISREEAEDRLAKIQSAYEVLTKK